MKSLDEELRRLSEQIPAVDIEVAHTSYAISQRITELMQKRQLSKKQFADALGRRPSEVTKWLSGQHNFTLRTIIMLADFFKEPIIKVVSDEPESEPQE